MGQFNLPIQTQSPDSDNLADNLAPTGAGGTGLTEASLVQALQNQDTYYRGLITQLTEEVRQLQDEKSHLAAEVIQLRTTQLQAGPRAPRFPLQFPTLPSAKTLMPRNLSQLRLGFILVLVSTIALSIHNVVVRIIGSKSALFGLIQLGGYLKLGYGNSLLILWYRMFFVLLLMLPVANFLYPSVWADLQYVLQPKQRRSLFLVMASGAFLFLSQVLIYVAIGTVGPSVAVTIFFMYPILTVPLAWLLFKDRPTLLRWGVMGTISLGVVLTALPSLQTATVSSEGGVVAAIASGISFAFYLILTQFGFKKLHPVPGSLVQFFTIFTLASSILIICDPQQLGVKVSNVPGFAISGIVLSVLTLVGYLANNFGVRFMGAARASIIASSGPVMTALLAFLLIHVPLQWVQILGIVLVTAGVTALSLEKVKRA